MTADFRHVLLTGGSGRLGTELRALLPGVIAPPRSELDITRPDMIHAALDRYRPSVVVHAAAYTDVAGAEQHKAACWATNVDGTRNLVEAAYNRGVFLVYISTGYVFDGTRGGYRGEDPVGPPRNYYALTKLVAESLVRLVPRHLLVRTSFRPREWAYPTAFTDFYTSQDYVDMIAPLIALAIQRLTEIRYDTLHIATERKSAYELARRRRPDVRPGSKREARVELPDDIALDTSRREAVARQWKEASAG